VNRRVFLGALAGGLLAAPRAGQARAEGKVFRVGYLTVPSRESAQAVANTFQFGLRDLGWIAGQNIVVSPAVPLPSSTRFSKGPSRGISRSSSRPSSTW